jgi:dCTP deaminase
MAKEQIEMHPKAAAAAAAGARGILPVQAIRGLVEAGHLRPTRPGLPILPDQLQPASVDLRLGAEAWRVRASFLPGRSVPVKERLSELALHSFDLGPDGKVLEVGCVYVVPLLEALSLPDDIRALTNPKSSTGRLDVFTRVIADGVTAFDHIPAGFEGNLWLEICPQSFPIVVRQGSRLSQIRFCRGKGGDSDATLSELHRRERLTSSDHADIHNGIALSVDLSPDPEGPARGLMGYRARRNTGVVDVDKPASCAIVDFWEPLWVQGSGHRLILDPDQFYILASKEAVHVPPTHAAEMVPFNPLVGEFRVHYAGFFDPGFGHAHAGGAGARAVLEVRSHKVPFILEDGQIVGRLVYERMTEVPDVLYGSDLKSHYQGQGLKLSKHFR